MLGRVREQRLRDLRPASLHTLAARSRRTSSAIRKLVARAGQVAKIGFPVHPHMLRHATGFKLANDGQNTRAIQHCLGHRSIQHTARYTQLSPERFDASGKTSEASPQTDEACRRGEARGRG